MTPLTARALTVALLLAAGTGPTVAAAQIYRWIDDAGVPHYAEGLDSVPERHRAGAAPLGLRSAPPAAETRAPAAKAGTVIRYSPGQPIMADVRINGSTSARLVLDTGADRTIISPRALTAAGVSLAKTIATGRVVGVTGNDRLPFVIVDSLEVGEARAVRLPVGAYEIAEVGGDGLLGRDFLDRFHVTIDSARGLVTLSPK